MPKQTYLDVSLSVIIPAKNESASIGTVVSTILQHMPDAEVIVVNDGSEDNTAHVAEISGALVISHPYSMGNGAAIKTGARTAKGKVLVFMDADGQHDPTDITRLLDTLSRGYDMVVGARSNGSQASLGRDIANRFYNRLASYMTGRNIQDLTSGFRAVWANRFREFLYLLPNGFSYPTTCTMAFFRAGYPVAYIPIHTEKRVGRSHIRILRDGLRFLIIIFRVGTLYSPLKLFIPVAAFFFLLATSWYGYTFVAQGRFTNMSALLYTGSVTVFLMGLISEQITALMYKDSG